MSTSHDLAAESQYAKDAKALERPSFQRLSPCSRRLLDEAESQARGLDDNHVGTEHIVLAIYGLCHGVATHALNSLGVTRELFAAQLHKEPGPSPAGRIPLTPRARMIVALAGAEASRTSSESIEPEHILLGVIRESQRWEATGIRGPYHLRAAAKAAGITLSALEQKLIHEIDRGR
jgi:ATP-dependent Clp protease ATP-binding subunit ClpA